MWIKLDDNLPDHPKIVAAGPLAGWLYICGLCFCNRFLTDGFIPERQLRRLADLDNSLELADQLIAAGLWEQGEGGYQVHDYLEHQNSKAQVETVREVRAEAGSKGGFAKAEAARHRASSKPLANSQQSASNLPEIISSKSLADKESESEIESNATNVALENARDDFAVWFESIWAIYPKRVGKQSAMRAAHKIALRDRLLVIQALHNYLLSEVVIDGYAKYPQGFLNDEYWRDYVDGPIYTKRASNGKVSQHAQNTKDQWNMAEQLRQKANALKEQENEPTNLDEVRRNGVHREIGNNSGAPRLLARVPDKNG